MIKKKLLAYFGIIAIGINVGACADTDQRGYYFTRMEEVEEKIAEGVTTQDEVKKLLGSPTTQSTFGEPTWYYIGGKSQNVAFFKPDVIDNQVLAITFDHNGVVQEVNKLGKDSMRTVNVVNRSTPTQGKNLSALEQILNNIGRFEDRKE